MLRSRTVQATVIGCLAALATFCALSARAADTYSVVAQSGPTTAASGRRPLAERIAAANLPIIAQTAATTPTQPPAIEDPENKAIPPVAMAAAPVEPVAADARAAKEAPVKAAPPKGLRLPWMAQPPVRSASRPSSTQRSYR